jgi:uncharacterized protein (TIGR04255 family)
MGSLPSFRKPPVVETVLAVQFDPIEGFSNGHLGAFWASLGDPWGSPSDVAPLDQAVEALDEEQTWGPEGIQLRLSPKPAARLRIVRADNDQMIQVQNGWFVYNWRKTANEPAYPRYGEVRREFDARLSDFRSFLETAGLPDIQPNLWEVTYVNHLDQGPLWKEVGDWADVVPGLLGRPRTPEAVAFETVSGDWSFVLGDKMGRLRIRLAHGKRDGDAPGHDGTEFLLLRLTARGPIPQADGWNALNGGLNLGRDCIVRTFTQLTSDRAHQTWEREV